MYNASHGTILLPDKQQNTTKGSMKWNASPGQNVRKYPRRSVVTQLSHVSSTRPERAVAPSPGHRPGLLRTQTCRPVRAKALKKQVINNAFALTGRIVDCYYTQGDALGYGLLGFQPVSTVQVENHHAVLLTGVRRGGLRDDPWAGVHPEVPSSGRRLHSARLLDAAACLRRG